MNITTIIERLNGFLAASGTRQLYVSEKTGIDKGKVSRIFSGKIVPRLEELMLICDAIGTPPRILFDEQVPIPPPKPKPPRRDKPKPARFMGIETEQPPTRVLGIVSHIETLEQSVDTSLQKHLTRCDNYHARTCGVLEKFVQNRRRMLGIGTFKQQVVNLTTTQLSA